MNPESNNNENSGADMSSQIFPKYSQQNTVQPQNTQPGQIPPTAETPPQAQTDAADKAAAKAGYRKFVFWNVIILIGLFFLYWTLAAGSSSSYLLSGILSIGPLGYVILFIVIGLVLKASGNRQLGDHFLHFAINIVMAVVIALLIGFGACLLIMFASGGNFNI